MRIAQHILALCESTSVEIGDILDTSHCNLDPRRRIGRIRGKLDKPGQYRVEYPDGEQGVLVSPKGGFIHLTTPMYQAFVDKLTSLSAGDPEIDMRRIIHKVNHWIDKIEKCKRRNASKGDTPPPDVPQAVQRQDDSGNPYWSVCE